jgi:hypothetical protein
MLENPTLAYSVNVYPDGTRESIVEHAVSCHEVTTRSTKVGYLIYLGNSNGVLLVLMLLCCQEESMLLNKKVK